MAEYKEADKALYKVKGYMVTITISGSPGSGKTTIAKLIREKLGLKHIYMGDIFRKWAQQYKMSLEEFGSYCEQHREIDEQLDKYQLELFRTKNVIIEGRIAGWIAHRNNIPAVKIWLDAALEIRATRLVNREKGTIQQRKKEIQLREQSEATRYRKYYNIDIFDTSIYDLKIDSSDKTPEEILDIVMKKIN